MAVGNPHNYKGKVTLQRVRLNSGGYDDMGRYFGTGQRLYYFFCEDDPGHAFRRDDFFRAADRASAKAYVRALPLMCECRFYN
ncbi:hypothetical protein [Bradyrhizobium retamae]|uniref:Uncharacterized protein n=1 Tax=Bradyrhizobium retamae TaxID=1300035 RepID=A0A0R3MPM1_9BRAD|nr:hypothetical protein [Bradyrhizobium retamae]KRR22146.1 hypothetical protein CQ13_29905 [Bradyrhizobium retamae]